MVVDIPDDTYLVARATGVNSTPSWKVETRLQLSSAVQDDDETTMTTDV
jgi:hypothetical protein